MARLLGRVIWPTVMKLCLTMRGPTVRACAAWAMCLAVQVCRGQRSPG